MVAVLRKGLLLVGLVAAAMVQGCGSSEPNPTVTAAPNATPGGAARKNAGAGMTMQPNPDVKEPELGTALKGDK